MSSAERSSASAPTRAERQRGLRALDDAQRSRWRRRSAGSAAAEPTNGRASSGGGATAASAAMGRRAPPTARRRGRRAARPHRLRRRAQRIDRREPGGGAGRGVGHAVRRRARRAGDGSKSSRRTGLRRGEHGARPALRLRQPRREAHGARQHPPAAPPHTPCAPHWRSTASDGAAPKTSADNARPTARVRRPSAAAAADRRRRGELSGHAARRAAEHDCAGAEGDAEPPVVVGTGCGWAVSIEALRAACSSGSSSSSMAQFSTRDCAQRLSSWSSTAAPDEHAARVARTAV